MEGSSHEDSSFVYVLFATFLFPGAVELAAFQGGVLFRFLRRCVEAKEDGDQQEEEEEYVEEQEKCLLLLLRWTGTTSLLRRST